MSERISTREKIVAAAMKLFYERGYQATGVNDVLREADAHTGSFYHFFRNKEAVLIAVLETYKEMLRPVVVKPIFDRTADPIERIFGLMDMYRRMLVSSKFRSGCPIGNLALEMAEKSEPVRKLVAENFANWRAAVRQCLDGMADRLPPEVDPDQLAKFILTVMEGGIMQARVHRSIKPFDAGVAVLRDYLDRLVAGGGQGGRAAGRRAGRTRG